ncbi:hypothetical protein LSH36_266g02045, partial [Paralvinella palmiformis]
PKDQFIYKFLEPWLGEGLLLSNGKKWSRNRRLLTPAFHFDILQPYVMVFSQSSNTLVDEDGRGLSDIEIRHEVDTFMFEGHDTTAGAKCREEVNSLLGDRTDFCWDDMSKLPFLTMCLKESLRVTPPVPNISRNITKSVTLPDGRVIPEGISALISIYGCHHNPDVWKNPHENCIGQNFAMNEMKTSLGIIIRNFHVSLDEERPPVKIPAITLRAQDGLWLKLEPL